MFMGVHNNLPLCLLQSTKKSKSKFIAQESYLGGVLLGGGQYYPLIAVRLFPLDTVSSNLVFLQD